MTKTAMLMREIETLPEESVAEALDFILLLRARKKSYESFSAENAEERFPSMNKPVHLGFDFKKLSREELYER